MTQTYSSVDCSEVHMTAKEEPDINQGIMCSVVLQCAWADRHALMEDLLINARPWPKSFGGVNPLAFHCVAVPAPGGSYVQDGQGCEYSGDAFVTVQYGTQIVATGSESIEPCLDYEAIDHRVLHWGSATGEVLLESEAPPLLLRTLNIVRTQYRLAAVPTEVLTCVGKCNNASVTSPSLGITFAAETLLFQPGSIQRSFTNFGTLGFTVSTKFTYKPNTWNKFRRASDGSYVAIYFSNGAQYKPYTPADFSALFV